MAKTKSPDDAILDALKKAIDALPELLPLVGTKALFAAKQADLAERAVADGYIDKRELPPANPKGKRAKPTVVAVVTEAGARRVAEVGGARDLKGTLESLRGAVEKLGKSSTPADPAAFRNAVENATATCVNAINAAFAGLRDDVMKAVTPAGGKGLDPAPLLAGITAALGRIQPTVVKVPVVAGPTTSSPAAKPTAASAALEGEITAFVEDWSRRMTVGCQFDVLMQHLRRSDPDVTIGAFHDALRRLHDSERIRLGGWPRMLDDLPEPELALLVSSKVMYYAQPSR